MKKNDEDEVGGSPNTLGEWPKGCISPFVLVHEVLKEADQKAIKGEVSASSISFTKY